MTAVIDIFQWTPWNISPTSKVFANHCVEKIQIHSTKCLNNSLYLVKQETLLAFRIVYIRMSWTLVTPVTMQFNVVAERCIALYRKETSTTAFVFEVKVRSRRMEPDPFWTTAPALACRPQESFDGSWTPKIMKVNLWPQCCNDAENYSPPLYASIAYTGTNLPLQITSRVYIH